jgi:hypothetical protein
VTSPESTAAIAGVAGAVGALINVVADALGEPVDDVRKRVLAQIEKDATDPRDETDVVAGKIDSDLPSSER